MTIPELREQIKILLPEIRILMYIGKIGVASVE